MTHKRSRPTAQSSVRSIPLLRGLKLWGWIALGLLIVVLYGCGVLRMPQAATTTPTPVTTTPAVQSRTPVEGDAAVVLRVVDGDTIRATVHGFEETIRYVGIDTPERSQPGYRAATEANRSYVEGKTVYLRVDRTHRDNFGRLLRYVYLEDGTFVNAEMVAQGWAQPVNYGRDLAHAEEFFALALEAARGQRGFWSGDSGIDGAMSYGLTTRPVDLYSGPGTEYRMSGDIQAETPLTLFGRSPNSRWLQVRPPDRDGGWISADAVRANVPIVTIPLGEVDGKTLTGGTPVPTATRAATATRAPASTSAPAATALPENGQQPALCPEGCLTPPAPLCNIKGNVGSSGERIYHLPGGALYQRTIIDPDTDDRWFCTPTEAEAAGFRRSLR